MAVLNQPGKMQQVMMDLPPALEYLKQVDRLNVRQKKVTLMSEEDVNGTIPYTEEQTETYNRYEVTNTQEQQVLFVEEESSCCEKACFSNKRGFVLHVTDNNSQEVMRITREFKWCTGCCWCADGCCNMEVIIEAPVGRVVGKATTSSSYWKGHFKIYDAGGIHLFTIWGPCCPHQAPCCIEDLRYTIKDPRLIKDIGTVGKQWGGIFTELCTENYQFYVEFPLDMLVDTKCLLFGTLFLVVSVVLLFNLIP